MGVALWRKMTELRIISKLSKQKTRRCEFERFLRRVSARQPRVDGRVGSNDIGAGVVQNGESGRKMRNWRKERSRSEVWAWRGECGRLVGNVRIIKDCAPQA